MGQDQKARGRGPVGVWAEPEDEAAADKAGEEVSRRAPVVIAFALLAERRCPTRSGSPVMSRNARSAAWP